MDGYINVKGGFVENEDEQNSKIYYYFIWCIIISWVYG